MQRLEHPSFRFDQSSDTGWSVSDKPIVIVDGALHRIRSLTRPLRGHAAYVVGAGDRDVEKLSTLLGVEYLHFYELRAAELSPLGAIQGLRNLKVHWDTKLQVLD